jgi:hypothetical protein
MKKDDNYNPADKFGISTDSETLKKAADFAAKIKKEKEQNVDHNK